MTLGTTLASVEKKFGPALVGIGDPDKTFSAIRFAAGKGKKFAGVPGIRDDAVFHLHFPLAVDWKQLKSKKGVPDFINNLTSSGPQGEQGREEKFSAFLQAHNGRARLQQLAGRHVVDFSIEGESFRYPGTVKVGKTGKITIQIVI
jgi:hypothetical protein